MRAPAFPLWTLAGTAAGRYADIMSQHYEATATVQAWTYLTSLCPLLSGVATDTSVRSNPRLYTVIVGPTGARKTTGVDAMERTLDLVYQRDAETGQGYPRITGVGSGEGLARALTKYGSLLLVQDEIAALFAKGAIAGSTLLTLITSLFDKTEYESYTKTETVEVRDVYLSILANSTTRTWERAWSREVLALGLYNRWLIIPAEVVIFRELPTPVPTILHNEIAAGIGAVLQHAASITAPIPWSPEARECHGAWQYAFRTAAIGTDDEEVITRLDAYAVRLITLLTVIEHKRTVDVLTVEKVIAIIEWQRDVRRAMIPLQADSPAARMQERIRKHLANKGPLKRWELNKILHAEKEDLDMITKALASLEKHGVVVFDGTRYHLEDDTGTENKQEEQKEAVNE